MKTEGTDCVMGTESRNPRSMNLSELSAAEIVKRMNEELSEMMGYTGIQNMSQMDSSVILHHGRHL